MDWAVEQKEALLDALQYTLDLIGLIPGFGNIADGINAFISYQRGDYLGAALSAAAAVPLVGLGVGIGKLAVKTARFASKAAKYIGKSAKAVAGSSKIASRTIDMVQSTAKRASNFVSNAWDGAVDFGRRVKCEWTGSGCFVEGTEVLIFEQVPDQVASSWQPVNVPEDVGQANGSKFSGAWIAMSAIGIVVVLAKKKKKKRDTSYQDELKQNSSRRSADDSSPLPVIEERELFSLQCQAGPTTENDFCNLEETHSFEGEELNQKSFNQAETTQRGVAAPTVQPVFETVPVTAETQAGKSNSWMPSVSAALCFLIFSFVSCWSYFIN